MPAPTEASALLILRTLRALGHDAYFAGGCVRDRLLGVAPKDWDIATSARPEQVQAAFPVTEAVGAAFGVILVIHDGAGYEVATFRSDGAYSDGRHPESVRFSSPEEDAQRRDFTVNGLFYDPDRNEIIDFVGGQEDLKAGILRAIGDPNARFDEDKLRVLRCVRFACQLGFQVEPETWAAAKGYAQQMQLLAWERISVELIKTLQSKQPRRGVELLEEAGLVFALLPELLPMQGCSQPPQFHPEGDVWEHTLQVIQHVSELSYEKGQAPSRALALAGLLHDVAKPQTRTEDDRIRFHGHESVGAEMTRSIAKRLKLSSELTEAAAVLVQDHLRLDPIKQMKLATLKRLLRRDDIEDLLTLHQADVLGSHKDLELYQIARAKQAEFASTEAQATLRPEPLVDGADLIAWGFTPGPVFKEILFAVEEEQLEGNLPDKAAARALVLQKWKPS
jgi:poly(A) polymerase